MEEMSKLWKVDYIYNSYIITVRRIKKKNINTKTEGI